MLVVVEAPTIIPPPKHVTSQRPKEQKVHMRKASDSFLRLANMRSLLLLHYLVEFLKRGGGESKSGR